MDSSERNHGQPSSAFLKRLKNRLLPRSSSNNIYEALKEWSFRGKYRLDYSCSSECDLCGHQKLKYLFEITHDVDGDQMEVGSSCILKFNIAVYDGINLVISRIEAERILNSLTKKMKKQFCIRSLKQLAASESNQILTGAVFYYEKHGKLTPKYARVIFWKLKQYQISFQPEFFKLQLSSKKYKEDLKEMQPFQVQNFWEIMTPAQTRAAIKMGFTPPSSQ